MPGNPAPRTYFGPKTLEEEWAEVIRESEAEETDEAEEEEEEVQRPVRGDARFEDA